MQIIKDIVELKKFLISHHLPGTMLGFVPTMGALHEGHLSLIRESVKNNDITLCSIYVNPTQFHKKEDLIHYPQSLEEDINMLKNEKCDAVFLPSDQMMYPKEPVLRFNMGYLDGIMEGRFRKGHFNGVLLIVSKLFNLIQPNNAYFGQKDLQQYVVLNTLVKELFFNINIVRMPIIRERDGLAMSSRNRRMDEREREIALNLYKALVMARQSLNEGMNIPKTKDLVIEYFKSIDEVSLEYFEIVDSESLMPVNDVKNDQSAALCIAGYVGKIRLIDNLII